MSEAGEQIWQDIQEIVNKKTDEYRVKLDSNVHCMDVGIQALKASDPDINYALKERLHNLLRKSFQNASSLDEALLGSRNTKKKDRTYFVEDPEFGDYIVAPSYGALQSRISPILKSSNIPIKFTGTSKDGKTTTNIGHLSLRDSAAATTPLEEKLNSLLMALEGVPIASTLVAGRLKLLQRYHKADTSYVFNRKSFNLQRFNEVLGTQTVLVVLQTQVKNSELATLEAAIESEIRQYLKSDKAKKLVIRAKGSNSIIEDLYEYFLGLISGKPLSTNTKHAPKSPKKRSNQLLANRAVTSSKPKKLPVRDLKGRFYSLTSLETLLKARLVDQVKQNMGDGSRRDILNLRSGRFAESVEVTRLSKSREGMITAFYTYMKYPYQTFEPGFKQGNPKSRDPKLLIARSIRDIASQQVSNRLRSVAV